MIQIFLAFPKEVIRGKAAEVITIFRGPKNLLYSGSGGRISQHFVTFKLNSGSIKNFGSMSVIALLGLLLNVIGHE